MSPPVQGQPQPADELTQKLRAASLHPVLGYNATTTTGLAHPSYAPQPEAAGAASPAQWLPSGGGAASAATVVEPSVSLPRVVVERGPRAASAGGAAAAAGGAEAPRPRGCAPSPHVRLSQYGK
jgi:hypothetical protein